VKVIVKLALGATLLLCASCGGGGDGTPDGLFTVSKNSAMLLAYPGSAPNPGAPNSFQHIDVTITSAGAAFIGAGVATVPDPGWLSVSLDGFDPNFDLILAPANTDLPEGIYTAVASVITTRRNGTTVLHREDIDVTYVVDKPVALQAPTLMAGTFVFGDSRTQTTVGPTMVAGSDDSYTVSTGASWIDVPETVFTGPGNVLFDIDVTGLAVGTHTANVTFHNTDPAKPWDTDDTLQVSVQVVAPTLTVSTPVAPIGGTGGLEPTDVPLRFSLNTGTRSHPWTATLTTDDAVEWLLSPAPTGTVSATQAQLALNADRTAVAPGVYTGNVKLDVDVDGHVVTTNVPVTLRRAADRLLVTADGVALTQLPSREVLTRDVRVVSSLARTDVPWSATSDQDWLAVTASGLTGGALTLTANPLLLAQDTLHEATVTVVSSDPEAANTETIRVGLWIASADPVAVTLPDGPRKLVMDPVAPLLYTHTYTNTINVYNVHTGALVTSYPVPTTPVPTGLGISSDGRTLFVHQATARSNSGENPGRAYAVRASDGELLKTYDFTVFGFHAEGLAYGRPDARPMLYPTASARGIDVATGEIYILGIGAGGDATVTADSRHVFVQSDFSAVWRATVYHSTLGGNALHRPQFQGSFISGSLDSAVSPDGSRLYGTDATPFESDAPAFPVFEALTGVLLDSIPATPFPNNTETARNGVFALGVTAFNELTDIWFYDATGTPLGSDNCGGTADTTLVTNSVRFSGDALRYVCTFHKHNTGDHPYHYIRDVPGSP
jgi:hypothetical protein